MARHGIEVIAGRTATIKNIGPIPSLAMEGFVYAAIGERARKYFTNEHYESCRREMRFDPRTETSDVLDFSLGDTRSLRTIRNASQIDGTAGAFVVGESMSGIVDLALFAGVPWRQLATVERIPKGGQHKTTIAADTNEGVETIEGQQESQVNCEIGELCLTPKLFSSLPFLVPRHLEHDSPEILPQVIFSTGAQRIARIQNRKFTSQVVGGATDVAAANASSIVTDDIVNLVAAIGPYLDQEPAPVFVCNATTYGLLLKLKDGQGQPLFGSDQRRMFGFKVVLSTHMESIGSGARSLLFGALQHVRIVDVQQARLDVFTESVFAAQNQNLWRLSMRSDCGVAVRGAVAVLKH